MYREENFEESDLLWKFLVLTTFRTLGKNSLDLWQKFFDKVFNTALYVSGGPISAERKCSANSFQIYFLKHCAKFFSNFHKVIMHGCRISSLCDRSIVFRKFFLKTNFFQLLLVLGGTFQNCWWKTSTTFVKTAIYEHQEIFWKKNCWFWQLEFFMNFFVYQVKVFQTFVEKNSTGLSKQHSKESEKSFEQTCFFWEN